MTVTDVLSYTNSQYIATNGIVYTLDSPSSGQATASSYNTSVGTGGAIVIPDQVSYDSGSGAVLYTVTAVQPGLVQNVSSINAITLPDSLISLGAAAFYGTSISTINIPANVTTFGSQVFVNNDNLLTITVSAGNSSFFTTNSDTRVYYINGSNAELVWVAPFSTGTITVNTVTNGGTTYNITKIWTAAFYKTNFTSYTFGNNLTDVYGAFDNNTSVAFTLTVGSGITSTDFVSGFGNYNMTSIDLTNATGITSIGSLRTTRITSLIIPNWVTTLDSGLLTPSTIDTVYVGSGVNLIYGWTFRRVPNLIIDASNTKYVNDTNFVYEKIDNTNNYKVKCFYRNLSSATAINIPGTLQINGITCNVIEIDSFCFRDTGNNISELTISEGITTLQQFSLYETNITKISLPTTLTTIANHAFQQSYSLTEIIIPASVTSIGSNLFVSSSNLTSIYFLGDKPTIDNDAFNTIQNTNPIILYYPSGNTTWASYTNTNFSSIQSINLYNPSTTYQSGDSVSILIATTIPSIPSGVTMNIEADVTITSAIAGSILNIITGNTATIVSGTATISGSGNIILDANNTDTTTVQIETTTFTGDITVSGDSTNTLEYTGNATLTLSGNIVKDGTTLTLDSSNGSIEVSGEISGVTAGASDIIIDGDVTFSNPENPYDGPTTIHSGATLTLNESSIPNSDVIIENGGTLVIINSVMPSSVNVKSITMSAGATLDVSAGYLKTNTVTITGGTIKTYAAASTSIICNNAATVSNTIQLDLYGDVILDTSYNVISAASGLSAATYNVTYYGESTSVNVDVISSATLIYLQVAVLQGFLFPAYLNPENPITTATTYMEVTDCDGLHLGTGNFEIEWTQYQYWYDNPPYMRVFSINSHPNAVISVSIEYINGTPKFYYWNNQGTYLNNIADISANDLINQWNTFKINRTSGVTKFYRNGVQFGSNLSDTQNITGSSSLIIGGDGDRSNPFTGWISSFRWTKGSPATNSFTIDTDQESGDMSGNIYYHTPSVTSQTWPTLTLQTPYPSCFNEGTMILCEVGGEEKYIPIEKLTRGDKVVSYLHGALSILAIGKGSMINDPTEPKRCMYKLQKTGNMIDDLILTGGHALLVDEKPKGLCFKIDDKFLSFAENDKRCVKMEDTERYTYYNMCLENNGNKEQRFGVWANGMLCETPSENQFNDHQYTELL